jgi:hypothetical protein
LIDATIILHNLLIAFGEKEHKDYNNFSDIAKRSPCEEGDELHSAVPTWAATDTRRKHMSVFSLFWKILKKNVQGNFDWLERCCQTVQVVSNP